MRQQTNEVWNGTAESDQIYSMQLLVRQRLWCVGLSCHCVLCALVYARIIVMGLPIIYYLRVAFRLPTKPRKLQKLDSGDSGSNAMGPPPKKDGDSASNAMGPPPKKGGDSGSNAMAPPPKKDTRKIHRCVCLVVYRACTRGRSTRGGFSLNTTAGNFSPNYTTELHTKQFTLWVIVHQTNHT